MMGPRRVVITGMGVVSPFGCGLQHCWEKLISGESAISSLPHESYGKIPCHVAALVPKGKGLHDLDIPKFISKHDLKKMSPATTYGLIAAHEALSDAQWFPEDKLLKERTGVTVGMGMIDLQDVCEQDRALKQGYNKVSPFFVPRILPNMVAGQISMKYGFHGPNHSVSTSCATGAHTIGDAFRFIKHGDADVMICGAAEACVSPLSIAAFCRLRALSTSFNENPKAASRPFDRDREGFVMGEGGAVLVLEELNHAKLRKAKIYGEILGYGTSGDATYLTSPSEDGIGATLAMTRALKEAGLTPKYVGYVNAHATSTPIGDAVESRVIGKLFGEFASNVAVSSTKGAHGHLLGAAGSLETLFTVMACYSSLIPPTINLENLSDGMDLNYVPNIMQEWKTPADVRRIALKNAFGFGGTNASLCIGQYIED